jgi:shikimate dehydrogenase
MAEIKNYKVELVGVFGHPVSENPSVIIQDAAFRALGLNFKYLTIEVLPQDLENAIKGIKALNFVGINLTIPHKTEVLKYLDDISEEAELIGAVNTVCNKNGKLYGDNTDGKGFIKSLKPISDPKNKSVVVLGAGGAARAISVELALNGVKHITIVNVNNQRGSLLANLINNRTATKADYIPWTSTFAIPDDTDILVNATSIGLFPDVVSKPDIYYNTINANMIVCDVIPNPPHTLFIQEAQKKGATTLDGLGMLINQGAIGFKMWTGFDAPTEIMKKALSKEFVNNFEFL